MSVQITNLSSSQIRIVMTAGATTFTYDIYKRYVTLLQPGTPIVTVLWHQYELDTHQRRLDIDYNDVTAPVVISSADLATQVQAFIDTIYSGGGGTPAGSDKEIQYNDSGAFGAEAGFEYDKTANKLTAPAILVSGLTASEIVITDASKNLASAPVATYPSLTELAYVKGVTSALQTQLDAITAKIQTSITSGSDYTNGTTGLTNVTGMAFTAAVNGSYVFEMYIRYTGSSTNGLRLAITFPAGGVLDSGLLIWSTAATNDQAAILQTSGTETITVGGTANNYFIKVAGSFVNGATGGTVQLQARSLNVANTVTLYTGGYTKAVKTN